MRRPPRPRSAALIASLLAVAACSARPPVEPPPVVLAPPDPCASGAPGAGCAEGAKVSLDVQDAPCINGPAGPRCDGLLAPREEKALTDAIDGAQEAVRDTAFGDVRVLIELARRQLRRDADIPDSDGVSDAARSVRNGMRSVAVDDASVEARFVLALALARSFQGAPALSDPVTHDLALGLVEAALSAVPVAGGPAGAATRALEGYVALELGQPARAREAFEYATQLDAGLATAWMGLGDVERSQGQFEAAEEAYTKAALLLPSDPGARRSVEAAKRREVLALRPPSGAARPALAPGPIAPAPPPLPACPPSVAAKPETATLCKGLSALAQASSRDDHEKAARLVIDGWQDVRPLCEAQDAVCGPQVAEALAACSRGYRAAGKPAKAIAAGKILLSQPGLPGASAAAPGITVEVADHHFALGMFSQAADHYAQHFRLKGASAGAAADRALVLYVSLMNVDAAKKLAGELAVDKKYSDAQRAAWLLLAAGLARAVQGPDAARSWLEPHRALLAAAGRGGARGEIAKPLPEKAAAPEGACAAPLACAVRRLAGEARWSPGAATVPAKPRPKPPRP